MAHRRSAARRVQTARSPVLSVGVHAAVAPSSAASQAEYLVHPVMKRFPEPAVVLISAGQTSALVLTLPHLQNLPIP